LNSDPPDIAAAKARLRAALRGRARTGDTPALIDAMRACVVLPAGSTIATLWPLEGEPDLRPLSHWLHADGFRVALPETPPKGQPLRFRAWVPGTAMLPGPFATSYPDAPEVTPDLIFVPLLAFDRRGFRMGYGGGYYDRTLAARPSVPAVGFAFAHQQVTEVPVGPYDVPLRQIVTEHGVLVCGGKD